MICPSEKSEVMESPLTRTAKSYSGGSLLTDTSSCCSLVSHSSVPTETALEKDRKKNQEKENCQKERMFRITVGTFILEVIDKIHSWFF